MTDQSEKALQLKALHEAGETFIIPNPWDVGTAKMLERAGFRALATTSSGFAWSLGRSDGEVTIGEKIEHCARLCAATDIPISVDFENGFADQPEAAAANLLKLVESGAAGASIEDWSRAEIYDFNLAVERIAACAEAVAGLSFPFQLTARAEGLLRRTHNLEQVLERLRAFESAGADVLYAPGLTSLDEVKATRDAIAKPLNVLAVFLPDARIEDYQRLKIERLSIGGALAGHARQATGSAIEQLATGRFDWPRR